MSGVIGRTAKAVNSFFWDTLKLKNIVSNVQINGPFYFYRNYFGQMLNYINLRGGIVAYTMGYNNDPTDSIHGDIQGTNYLVENLRRNGATTVNDKYKADNQRTIDGYWPFNEESKYKNTFSKKRNIGNIVNLDYSNIIDVRNKDYTFDDLQETFRNNTFYVWDKKEIDDKILFSRWAQKVQKDNDFKGIEIYKQKKDNDIKKDYQNFINEHASGSTSVSIDGRQRNNFYDETRTSINVNPTSLIEKTANFFKERKIKSIVSSFYSNDLDELDLSNELDSGYDRVNYGYSRGRNLKKDKSAEKIEGQNGEEYTNPYCRTWTAIHQYDRLSRLIRPIHHGNRPEKISDTQSGYKDLRPNNGALRLENNTVLDRTGFVKITPISSTNDKNHDIKKCMFSIENLAWRDIKLDDAKISKEQQGPNGGRIMWFPPYNLKFTENVNVDWNANKFIGRGEQIYTYTNTDRQGTLNFTLLIDHPSILNKYVGNQKNVAAKDLEEDILKYFAGCGDLNGESSNEKIEPKGIQLLPQPELKMQQKTQTEKVTLIAFFPNNWTGADYEKENDIDRGLLRLRQYERNENPTGEFTEIDKKKGIFTSSPKNIDSALKLNNFKRYDEGSGEETETYREIANFLGFDDEKYFLYSFFDEKYGVYKLSSTLGATSTGVTGEAGTISNGHIFQFLCPNYKLKSIKIVGYASSQGNNDSINKEIARRRGNFLKNACLYHSYFLRQSDLDITVEDRVLKVSDNEKKVITTQELVMIADNSNVTLGNKRNNGFVERLEEVTELVDLTPEEEINKLRAKLARCATVTFEIEWNSQTVPSNTNIEQNNYVVNQDASVSTSGNSSNIQNEASKTVVEENTEDYSYDNEYLYFQDIANNGKMQYEYIAQKVKYFNPAFHSITPEGFNARLTFLHQCTRQGPTNDLSSGKINSNSNSYLKYAGNLAFGRPPYCILRIGDFYHTKICITALSIDYDNGGGIQWDLNPEGIGVQPMFANITMNFTFLGGQDLTGPIERLQNAVTANYYANASVYDNKADIRGNNGEAEKIYNPTKMDKNRQQNSLTQKLKQQTAPPTSFARPGFGSGFGSLSGQTI